MTGHLSGPPGTIDEEAAWRLILAARGAARSRELPEAAVTLGFGPGGGAVLLPDGDPAGLLLLGDAGAWRATVETSPEATQLFDLYLGACRNASDRPKVTAHLGQSLDGRIATESGDSSFVTGPENILHLHRMRALADAIVVGAGTVALDDPRLTTRQAAGDNPVRVVVDTERRLTDGYRVFSDGEAPTLLFCGAGNGKTPTSHGRAEVIEMPERSEGLALDGLVEALGERGLQEIFVEGGGKTVSRFLAQGLIDRLQVAVAPVIIGSGRQGFDLPPIAGLGDALRLQSRCFPMGRDILFDCYLGD